MSEPPEDPQEPAVPSPDDAQPEPSARDARAASPSNEAVLERLRELEHLLVRCEGTVRGLQQRVSDLEAAQRLGRRRALLFRLALLVLLFSAYLIVRSRYSG